MNVYPPSPDGPLQTLDGRRLRQPTSLAPCQEAQWEFMLALAPDDPGRSLHVVVENRYLEGGLDHGAMSRAFADVTRRHDGLRLAFDSVGPDPRVRVDDHVDLPLEHLDLAGLDPGRQRTAIDELSFRENRRCFDLRRGPLWHAWLVRLAPTTHLLNACLSHIIADGWCAKVFVEDLLAAYGARVGQAPPLPDDALSFAEIHALQNRQLEARPDRVRYWQERLRARPVDQEAVAELRGHPSADLMARSTIEFWFPEQTVAELRRVAWRARTTHFVALLAGYHLLICLTRGTDRSVINSAMGLRRTSRARRALFQFTVDPYVCTDVPAAASLLEVVRATTRSVEAAGGNAVSYQSLARAVNPDFDAQRPWPSYHLCDGGFIDTAFYDPLVELSGLRVTQAFIPGGPPAGHAPALVVSQLPDAVAPAWAARTGPGLLIYPGRAGGKVRFNHQIHSAESMHELLRRYLWVVEAVATQPDLRVDALRERFVRTFAV